MSLLLEEIIKIQLMMGLIESNIQEQSASAFSRFLLRRSNEENLEKYITAGELAYPMLCEDFEDEYDYADAVIRYTLDELIGEFESLEGIIDYDNEQDINTIDDFINLCRDLFGDYLTDVYMSTCSEDDEDDEDDDDDDYDDEEDDIDEEVYRIKEIIKIINESDPKVGTGKKPKGSDRRLYTDENPSDTVSVKFRTKQDIVDTLNKESFKSKSHARQSQIINLIHQRLRVALERAKDPEVKKRLKTAFEYIESKKEQSKKKTQEMKEGVDTKQDEPILNDSGKMYYIDWDENYGKSFKIVHTPEGTQNGVEWNPNMVSVITPENGKAWNMWVELSPKKLLKWKDSWNDIQKSLGVYKYNQIVRNMSNNLQENIHRIKEGLHDTSWENEEGDKITLMDLLNATEDIPVERVSVEELKRQEEMKEGELTERCWAGYEKKGMKTMFGKRYPNCVKKTK